VIFSSTSSNTSMSPKTVTVNCGGGTNRLLGGGAFVSNPGNAVALTASYPASTTSWTASAFETKNYGSSWSITAYALCA
jgi:hypothetical protein